MRFLRLSTILFLACFQPSTPFLPHASAAALPWETAASSSLSSSSSSSSSWTSAKQNAGSCSLPPQMTRTNDVQMEEPSPSSSTTSFHRMLLRRVLATDSYFLIWSPGMAKSLITWTAALAVGNWFYPFHELLPAALPPTLSLFGTNIVLPLAASACCLIQMALNVLSAAGCAGFNTVLGPIRPFFLSLLLVGTITTTSRSASLLPMQLLSKRNVARWLVALSPEIVHGINQILSWRSKAPSTMEEHAYTATITLEVPTMGCVACINAIDGALRRASPYVLSASSSLREKGGVATVQVAWKDPNHPPPPHGELVQTFISAMAAAGFDQGRVESIEIAPNK